MFRQMTLVFSFSLLFSIHLCVGQDSKQSRNRSVAEKSLVEIIQNKEIPENRQLALEILVSQEVLADQTLTLLRKLTLDDDSAIAAASLSYLIRSPLLNDEKKYGVLRRTLESATPEVASNALRHISLFPTQFNDDLPKILSSMAIADEIKDGAIGAILSFENQTIFVDHLKTLLVKKQHLTAVFPVLESFEGDSEELLPVVSELAKTNKVEFSFPALHALKNLMKPTDQRDSRSQARYSSSGRQSRNYRISQYVNALFKRYDKNNDELLNESELKEIQLFPANADENGDGSVDKRELVSGLGGSVSRSSSALRRATTGRTTTRRAAGR